MSTTDLIFDYVKAEELQDAIVIEGDGFPPDEAADLDKFRCVVELFRLQDIDITARPGRLGNRFRQREASDLFLGVYMPQEDGKRKIIGYICSTLSPSETLTHDSMYTHVPNSSYICLHSVCISKQHQRKGIATKLLKEYVGRLRSRVENGEVPYESIVLLAHDNLISLYENVGFRNVGKSDVVHGSLPWFELKVDLKESKSKSQSSNIASSSILAKDVASMPPAQQQQETQQIPPGVWEALLKGSSMKNRPQGKLLQAFENGLGDVIDSDSETQGLSVNKFDLLCPRPECGSIILKGGVGSWVERASEQIQPPEVPLSPLLAPLPPDGETTQWWLIKPSPMAFENISFTRPIGRAGSRMKLLACAECELGPLGWSKEGGTEFWLACSRVAYRT